MDKVRIETIINGKHYIFSVFPNQTLLDFLREELGLTGTKRGCEIGECGACTVLINGKAVNSCLVLVPQINNKEILTVEGMANGDELHPLQKSFIEHGAVHCGFCTPGLLMTSKELIEENPNPTEEEIRNAIAGNLCRCSGYVQIVEAIKNVGRRNIDQE